MSPMKPILLLVTLATCAFAQDAAITANSKSFAEALLHKDPATIKRLTTDNLTVIWSDAHTYDRAAMIDIAHEGTVHEYTPYRVHVAPIDDNSTLITYDCIIAMPEGDTDIAPRYQHVSELWIKQGGEWKLRFEQFTAARPVD